MTGGGSLCCRSFFCQTRSRPSSPESLANAGLGLLGAHRDNAERQGAVKNHLKETLEGCSALMTQSQNHFGWKGPLETIQSNSTQAGSDPEQSPILTAGHFTASHAPDPVSNHLHRLLCVCVSFLKCALLCFGWSFLCFTLCSLTLVLHRVQPAPSPPHAPSRELLMRIDHTTPAFLLSRLNSPFLTQFTCFVSEQLYNKQIFELNFILLKKTR